MNLHQEHRSIRTSIMNFYHEMYKGLGQHILEHVNDIKFI